LPFTRQLPRAPTSKRRIANDERPGISARPRHRAAHGGVTSDRPTVDWYVPFLFMRLKGGCLWYAPGFEGDAGLENWNAVIQHIGDGRWTPIIGPGLNDALLGSRREIARRWADTFHFPMAPYNREDLPQVAQYVAINQHASTFPQKELIQYLGKDLLAHFGDKLSDELRQMKPGQPFPVEHVSKLISFLGSQQRKDNPAEPFRVLAGLELPIYITASQSNLIADALRDAGKQPRVEFCRWNDDLLELPGIYGKNGAEPEFRPSPQQPLVYHLFGHLNFPESIVITEDDYFDFLIGMMKNTEFIPDVVKRALTDTGLVFLGFQLDDWNFRVMFRAIKSTEGPSKTIRARGRTNLS
jgi:SIR2-like domain